MTVSLRFGSARPGPEALLVERALEMGLPRFSTTEPVLMMEPELEVGRPDIVVAYRRDERTTRCSAGPPLDDIHWKLLHLIYELRWTTTDDLAALTCFTPCVVEQAVDDLSEYDYLRWTRRGVRARALPKVFGLTRIVAIEAKISDWRRAVLQAHRNYWFASDSYVLLPAERCTSAALEHARSRGVGVLSVGSSRTRLRQRANRAPLPSSYASWVLCQWALSQGGTLS
jgi:hypothetical protein